MGMHVCSALVYTCVVECGIRRDQTCGETRVDVFVSAEARVEIFVSAVHYMCVCVDTAFFAFFVIIQFSGVCSFVMV